MQEFAGRTRNLTYNSYIQSLYAELWMGSPPLYWFILLTEHWAKLLKNKKDLNKTVERQNCKKILCLRTVPVQEI